MFERLRYVYRAWYVYNVVENKIDKDFDIKFNKRCYSKITKMRKVYRDIKLIADCTWEGNHYRILYSSIYTNNKFYANIEYNNDYRLKRKDLPKIKKAIKAFKKATPTIYSTALKHLELYGENYSDYNNEIIMKTLNKCKDYFDNYNIKNITFENAVNEYRIAKNYYDKICSTHYILKDTYNDYKDVNWDRIHAKEKKESYNSNLKYFNTCETIEEVKSLQKKLVRTFHPDNLETGDPVKFEEIMKEYETVINIMNGNNINKKSTIVVKDKDDFRDSSKFFKTLEEFVAEA